MIFTALPGLFKLSFKLDFFSLVTVAEPASRAPSLTLSRLVAVVYPFERLVNLTVILALECRAILAFDSVVFPAGELKLIRPLGILLSSALLSVAALPLLRVLCLKDAANLPS